MIFFVGTITQLLLFRIAPRQALSWGLLVLLVGLALIELGLWDTSLGIFVAGTIAGGLAVGLLFMGSLAIVNQIAELDRRAQVLAAYFVCTYAGLAVPAIVVGRRQTRSERTRLRCTARPRSPLWPSWRRTHCCGVERTASGWRARPKPHCVRCEGCSHRSVRSNAIGSTA